MKHCLLPLIILLCGLPESWARVIIVSIDGLRPDAVTAWGPEALPNFYRLRTEGSFTDNARTDFDNTETLPNHTTMITGRPVLGDCGHGLNVNIGNEHTDLHSDGYVASMFDVAHDYGFSTALYAVKSKFRVFSGNYNGDRGALDLIGEDNGRNKIDDFAINFTDSLSVSRYLSGLQLSYWDFSMLHIGLPDSVGHAQGWSLDPASSYMNAVITVDGYLGQIFEAIETDGVLNGATFLIVTSDHGGEIGPGHIHNEADHPGNYTVPLYVWGPGVKAGADLYELNPDFTDPGTNRPNFNSVEQPIRNGMVGNLALDLLGLPAIPGSCHNLSQRLLVSDPKSFSQTYPWLDPDEDTNGNGFSNFFDYAIGANPQGPHRHDLMPRMIRDEWSVCLRTNTSDVQPLYEISANGVHWFPIFEGVTLDRISSTETDGGMRVNMRIPMVVKTALFRQSFAR